MLRPGYQVIIPKQPQLRHVILNFRLIVTFLNMFAGISGNQPSPQGLYIFFAITIVNSGF